MTAKKNNTLGKTPAPAANINTPGKSRLTIKWKLSFLLAVISFLVYANTLNNGYVLDDQNVITQNMLVRSGVQAIPEILVTPYRYGWAHLDNDQYRPLSVVIFAIECQLFSLDPAPAHLVNILLFAGCVILLFLFLDGLFSGKRTAAAFIAALLFALHPVHTEVVANIKSTDELLCFFFSFLSLGLYRKYVNSGRSGELLTGAFCFLLALLAKETSITFLIIIPLVFFCYINQQKKRSAYATASAIVVAAIFLFIRFAVLSHYNSDNIADNDMIENALANPGITFETRIATAVLMLGYYLKLLLLPYPLICDYSYNSIPYAHITDAGVLLSFSVYLLLIVFCIRRLFKRPHDPYAFGIIFFLVSISLFANIFFLIGATMAERFLFFGSAGFCLVAAMLIEQLLPQKEDNRIAVLKTPKVFGTLIIIALIYTVITINRNKDWVDEHTLFSTDVAKAPNDSRLNYYAGDEILTAMVQVKDPPQRLQMAAQAADYLSKAVNIYPEYQKAQFDLGTACWILANFDSAEFHYQRAIQLGFKGVRAMKNMAGVYFEWGKYPESITYYKKAITLDPDNKLYYVQAGLCYQFLGKYDSAICYANKAIAIDPSFGGSYEVLLASYKAIGNRDSIAKYEALTRRQQP